MEFFKIMKLLNKKFYMILLVFVGLIFSGAIFISTYPSPGDILDKIEEFISNPKQCASSNSDFSKAAKSIAWDSEEMIIIEEVNAMPKRMVYSMRYRKSGVKIADLMYRLDAGCAGITLVPAARVD
ncbi:MULTISPECIES: hypothetical protein [Delftia]|nr:MULTISPECIES: hypothetical protein [Delftia]MCP4016737.1 hypothetical protein [Delftia sp.]QPS74379.1 hypothetical protein I6G48_27745 [Delftia acidovorans]